MDINLVVIPKPEHASIIHWAKDNPFTGFVVGGGYDNLLCGNCGEVLCKDVNSANIQNLVFVCPQCDKYNLKS
jgi:predicted RNA-binding Zn-ribbon protein involved in translation (DUF1610 family)